MDFKTAREIEIVKLIENGADNWNRDLHIACEYGHMDIVNLMIYSGADNWNYAFRGACLGGHMDLVKLLIDSGADDWNGGLFNACRGGHMDIVKLMIDSGADDLNNGIYHAYNVDIVNLIIGNGANCNDMQLVEFKKSKEFNGLNDNIIRFILNKY